MAAGVISHRRLGLIRYPCGLMLWYIARPN